MGPMGRIPAVRNLIIDDGEGTVDTVHQNDIGMLRQAECLLPVLRKLLR